MTKSLKLISIILAALFLITGTMLVAFADEPVDAGGGDVGTVDVGGDTGGDAPVVPDAPVTPDAGGGDAGTGSVDVGGDTGAGGTTDYNTGSDYNTGGGTVDYNTDTGSDYGAQTYSDPEPIYYGNASDYDYNTDNGTGNDTSAATTNPSKLYSTSGISDEEVAPNEWSEITLDEKTASTGVTNFASIKTNTEKNDDSQWILYLGYGLIFLAVLGILYFIIATIVQRKKNRKIERMERRRSSAPVHSASGRMEAQERRTLNERTPRYTEEDMPRSRRARAKADTGEVYVPRRASR